jgi:hypothetical protein
VSRAQPLQVAAWLAAAEGAALAAVCLGYLAAVLGGHPNDRPTALFAAGLGLAAAALLVALSRPLGRGRRYARTPVVLMQLLALPVGAAFVQAHRYPYAVAVLVPAVAALALLAIRSARAPFEFRR